MKDLLEKNVQVQYNKELLSLEVSFHGFVPYDTMVRALQHEYVLIRHYRLKKCLVDLREMGIYAPGVSELIQNEWFPKVISEGVAFIAFVVPESVFGQQSMNKAHQKVTGGTPLTTEYFKDSTSAKEWIANPLVAV